MSEYVLQMALEDLGYETRSYSGRGMFGKTCLGFVVRHHDGNSWLCKLVRYAAENPDEGRIIADELESYSDDNMGLDTIIYFPDVPYISEVVEEGDELNATRSTRDDHYWYCRGDLDGW